MKYAGAGIVIVGAAAAGAYYGTMPKGPTETGTETTAETTKPGEKLRLDMVVWTWGIELIQDHVRMFNEAQKDYDVHLSDYSQEGYREGIISRFTGGTPTDLMYSSIEWQVEWQTPGWIVPTEVYVPEVRQYQSDITPGYWPGHLVYNHQNEEYNGKMWGTSYYGDYTGFWYNPDHLMKAGIDEPPKTWEELVEQSLKIKQKGIVDYPMCAFLSSYGFWQTLYCYIVGITKDGRMFDKETSITPEPIWESEDSALFKAVRFLVDCINKDKIMTPDTIRYDDPVIISNMASEAHTFGWLPRYDIPGVNTAGTKVWENPNAKGVKQALNPGSNITSCWLRPYNMTKYNADRGQAAIDAQWKLQCWFGGKADDNCNPDFTNGSYRVPKRLITDVGVGTVMESLWQDPDVIAAYTAWNTGFDVMLEQRKHLYLQNMDGQLTPYWPKWSGGWGTGYARAELESTLIGQRGTSDADIMKVFKDLATKYNEFKKDAGY